MRQPTIQFLELGGQELGGEFPHWLNMELSIMCESSFSELLVDTYMLHVEDMQKI
jgi:hypothetical protein